jgi:hypothetical protein
MVPENRIPGSLKPDKTDQEKNARIVVLCKDVSSVSGKSMAGSILFGVPEISEWRYVCEKCLQGTIYFPFQVVWGANNEPLCPVHKIKLTKKPASSAYSANPVLSVSDGDKEVS